MNPLDKKVYEVLAFKRKDGYEPDYAHILLSDVLEFMHQDPQIVEQDRYNYPYRSDTKLLDLWDFKLPTYEEQGDDCKNFIRNLTK